MSDVHVKAVPTEYRGIPFRSRLEAKYARALDLMGVEYKYEPEVFDLGDGISYCPDFYLPESGIYLEVKGKADRYDVEKVKRFSKERRLIVGFDDRLIALNFPGKVYSESDSDDGYGKESHSPLGKVAFRRSRCIWEVESNDNAIGKSSQRYLVKCPECGLVQFLSDYESWDCQSCGFYDGDYILGFTPFGLGGEETLLELVDALDVAPYRRPSMRRCINCRHALPGGDRLAFIGCMKGVRKFSLLDDILGMKGCLYFETAR